LGDVFFGEYMFHNIRAGLRSVFFGTFVSVVLLGGNPLSSEDLNDDDDEQEYYRVFGHNYQHDEQERKDFGKELKRHRERVAPCNTSVRTEPTPMLVQPELDESYFD
jgi:hypothetical protein